MLAALPIIQALIGLAGAIPSLVTAGETVLTLIREGRDPTPAEQALFDQALADADAALPAFVTSAALASVPPGVAADIVAMLPKLRAQARSICRGGGGQDDLVQDTVVRALGAAGSFDGSNLAAWLFTIMRHEFCSAWRKRRHEVADGDGEYAARLGYEAPQLAEVAFREVDAAMGRLVPAHREALELIAGLGLSYDDAATIAGCAVGTVKSRVSRARATLAGIVGPV